MKSLRFTVVFIFVFCMLLFTKVNSLMCQSNSNDMVMVPSGKFNFHVEYRWREGLTLDSLIIDDQGQRYRYSQYIHVPSYYIDRTEVTNEQFKKFLIATGYEPKWQENFLKRWGNGNYPEGKAKHPVVWVSVEDAQAYCKFMGKRHPTEE